MRFPSISSVLFTGVLTILGAVAGLLFTWIGTPLPYMLGSLVTSAALAMRFGPQFPEGYRFPGPLRMLCVGVIGVMIGAQVSPDIVALVPTLVVSIPAVLLFVGLAHWLNFTLFRRLGGFDRPTAFYAASPGGLIESIAFGEEAGADIQRLTIMQFLRIIVVVTLLPVAISIYEGAPVGSAAGLSLTGDAASGWEIAMVLALALAGVALGKALRLPAGQLAGALLLVGIASGAGLLDLTIPGWLVAIAQVLLGTSLGLRFTGITRKMLLSSVGLSVTSVLSMLVLGAAISLAVMQVTPFGFETLIISFAPGGVTEMSLIALSIAANPAFVSFHHLLRIVATVVELTLLRKTGLIRF